MNYLVFISISKFTCFKSPSNFPLCAVATMYQNARSYCTLYRILALLLSIPVLIMMWFISSWCLLTVSRGVAGWGYSCMCLGIGTKSKFPVIYFPFTILVYTAFWCLLWIDIIGSILTDIFLRNLATKLRKLIWFSLLIFFRLRLLI